MSSDSAAHPPLCTHAPLGPGLGESVAWSLGYVVVQIIAAAALLLLLVLFAFEGWPRQPNMILQILWTTEVSDPAWLSMYLTGGATLGALFLIIPAAMLRLRPSPRASLGMHFPDGRQLVLLAGAILPLGILSDEVYRAAALAWNALRGELARFWPSIEHFGHWDTIDLIQSQTAYTAYPLLLVIVGVGPAIGEEIIFRGVIGRGLVNRFGVVSGVALTSLLFAAAHGTPAHAMATLPLAVFLHLTYLATRTIWAPILMHFLNNALSVTMLKYGLGENLSASPHMLVSAAIYVTAIGALVWHTRNGTPLLPAPLRRSTMLDDNDGGTAAFASPRWLTLLATTGVIAFTWTFVAAAMAG